MFHNTRLQGMLLAGALLSVAGCGPGGPTGSPDLSGVADLSAAADMTLAVGADMPVAAGDMSLGGALVLPGNMYYPESLNAAADGSLYVGSIATGQVVKFPPGSTSATMPTVLVAPGGTVKGVTGVYIDDSSSTLYLCSIDPTFAHPETNSLRSFNLADGTAKTNYPFPGPNLCNDMTLDGSGNLYVTDSFGKIFKLAKGDTTLKVWSSDPLLAPSMMGGFGADGIVYDGKGNLYVNTFSDARLLRIPVNVDGTAGTVVKLTVTPALQLTDGMRLLDANTLLVVEGIGRLTKVALTGNNGTGTVIRDGLNGPTAVVKVGTTYWVTEGQIGHFTGQISGPPSLPFLVRPVPAI